MMNREVRTRLMRLASRNRTMANRKEVRKAAKARRPSAAPSIARSVNSAATPSDRMRVSDAANAETAVQARIPYSERLENTSREVRWQTTAAASAESVDS